MMGKVLRTPCCFQCQLTGWLATTQGTLRALFVFVASACVTIGTRFRVSDQLVRLNSLAYKANQRCMQAPVQRVHGIEEVLPDSWSSKAEFSSRSEIPKSA